MLPTFLLELIALLQMPGWAEQARPSPMPTSVETKNTKAFGRDFKGLPSSELRSIKVPTLIMQSERDGVRPEHTVELMRLIPNSQPAIFPNGDDFIIYTRPKQMIEVTMAVFEPQ